MLKFETGKSVFCTADKITPYSQTSQPAYKHDDNDYVAEIVFNGVVGECRFDVVVEPIPPADYIDIDGDSPRVVKMGECQTLSVSVGWQSWGADKFDSTD